MRILLVCPFFPLPQSTGIRLREYNLIKQLARSHDITLFAVLQSPDEYQYVDQMRPFCSAVEAVLPQPGHRGVAEGRRTVTNVLLGVVDASPQHFYGTPYRNVAAALCTVLTDHTCDVLLVDTLAMCNYVWGVLPSREMKTILVEHNVETHVQRQQYELATSPLHKLRKWIYYRSFIRYERAACRRFDRLVTVSDLERRRLMALVPEMAERIVVVPNGVDTVGTRPNRERVPRPGSVIYSGAVTYGANLDAVTYFVDEIWPLIRAREPGAELRITGDTGHVDVRQLAGQPGVTFTGHLPSVAAAIQESWALVVPLRQGGGTRLKILEAMALGTPVVSTSLGAEGLNVRDGRDLVIADTPRAMADGVCALFRDAALRSRLSAAGRAVVEAEYDWEIVGRRLMRVIDEVSSPSASEEKRNTDGH